MPQLTWPFGPRGSWKSLLGGLATALVLLPVPAYATLTWNGFTGPSGWTINEVISGNSDTLSITPPAAGGSGAGIFTFTTSVTQTNHTSNTVTPNISGLNNFTLTSGETLNWQVIAFNPSTQTTLSGGNPAYTSGNQFSGPGSGPAATQTGQSPISATSNGQGGFSVSVTFTFTGTGSWSVASTPVTVQLNSVP